MNKIVFGAVTVFVITLTGVTRAAETHQSTNAPAWITSPLSLAEAIDLALRQNSAILKGKSDLEATYGVAVQTRAIAIPKLRATGDYEFNEAVENISFTAPTNAGFPSLAGINPGDQRWSSNIRLVQSIYEGGRITSALRSARLSKEQALLQYQAVIADSLLEVRVAYHDVLLGAQQIVVQEASLGLLQKELEDTTRRSEAGTVPRFNVLRAEVEVANARPRLIRARSNYRIAKNNLANLLGYNVPANIWEDIPLQLSGKLEPEPYEIELPAAIAQALEKRPELGVLRKAESLRKEAITTAKSGYKPSVQLFAGYGSRSPNLTDDLARDISGWNAGAQLNWDIFDGLRTKGRIQEAEALHEKARLDLEDNSRRVELEVRTAYSNFIEAKEVLESQKKVQEQADEALRLAISRSEAGTGTQLDVLNAQTALTEARTTQIQALRDYLVTKARLGRAIGESIVKEGAKDSAGPTRK